MSNLLSDYLFYEEENPSLKIYCGDIFEVIDLIEGFDCVMTSPPYNLGNNHHTGAKKHNPYNDDVDEIEYQFKQVELLDKMYDKASSFCFYNHQNRFKDGEFITPYQWILRSKWKVSQEVVWHRGSPNMDKCRFFPFTERIYMMSKPNPSCKFENKNSLIDDWHVSPVGTNGVHTRAFPIQIAKRCIGSTTSQIVFDPYVGSGTTLVACKELGLSGIGVEVNRQYCEVARNRLMNTQRMMI